MLFKKIIANNDRETLFRPGVQLTKDDLQELSLDLHRGTLAGAFNVRGTLTISIPDASDGFLQVSELKFPTLFAGEYNTASSQYPQDRIRIGEFYDVVLSAIQKATINVSDNFIDLVFYYKTQHASWNDQHIGTVLHLVFVCQEGPTFLRPAVE